jgi:LPS-assembly lipoprotein
MPRRRALRLAWLAIPLLLSSALSGCGWAPLYADPASGPADAALRAVRVAPIAERIGQKLELGLRESLNPSGESAKQRYLLRTTLIVQRTDLGILTQGAGTRGRLDVFADYILNDIVSGAQLTAGRSHVAESFDILANGYANVVAEDDARTRAIEELRRDLVERLTLFLQRTAAGAGKP